MADEAPMTAKKAEYSGAVDVVDMVPPWSGLCPLTEGGRINLRCVWGGEAKTERPGGGSCVGGFYGRRKEEGNGLLLTLGAPLTLEEVKRRSLL